MEQLFPALALHEQILGDLRQREQALPEREAEARKALEDALARFADERASIGRDRNLLAEAEQLYRRFSNRGPGDGPRLDAPPPAPAPREQTLTLARDAISERSDSAQLVDAEAESHVTSTIRNLRQQLIGEGRG